MRVGLGYDVHKLVEGRKLIIGGVNVPHEKGLLGHSDADVLIHAVMPEVGVLNKQVNILDVFQVENGQRVRRSLNSVA